MLVSKQKKIIIDGNEAAAMLEGRVPLIHFFDGHRTSHDLDEVDAVDRNTVNKDWCYHPDPADKMFRESQQEVDKRYNHYKTLSALSLIDSGD